MARTIAAVLGVLAPRGSRAAILAAAVTSPIAVSLTSASAASASVTADYNPSSPLDWVATAAQVVTALSVIFLYVQIKEVKRNAKSERTRGFQERYLSDEFSLSAAQALGCMRARDAGGCVDVIKTWSDSRDSREKSLPGPDGEAKASAHDIAKTLGYFEDMGTAYNMDQLDEEVIQRSFATPTVNVLTSSWWFICWHRKGRLAGEIEDGRTEDIYAEFQKMCQALRLNKISLKKNRDLTPSLNIRALCLPRNDEGRFDDKTWEDSRRLSLALAKLVRSAEQNGGVARAFAELAESLEGIDRTPPAQESPVFRLARQIAEHEGGDKSNLGWDVLLVPQSIDQPCDQGWKDQRAAAKDLSQSLDRIAKDDAIDAAIGHIESGASSTEQPLPPRPQS